MRGLPGKQHATLAVGHGGGDHLQEPICRDPCDPIAVTIAQDGADPCAHTLSGAERRWVVVAAALQIYAPSAGERDEQHVAAAGPRVLVVIVAFGWERMLGIRLDVDDDVRALRASARHGDADLAAHRGARAVGPDDVVGTPVGCGSCPKGDAARRAADTTDGAV